MENPTTKIVNIKCPHCLNIKKVKQPKTLQINKKNKNFKISIDNSKQKLYL